MNTASPNARWHHTHAPRNSHMHTRILLFLGSRYTCSPGTPGHSGTYKRVPDTKTHPGVLTQRHNVFCTLLHLLKNMGLLESEVSWGLVPESPAVLFVLHNHINTLTVLSDICTCVSLLTGKNMVHGGPHTQYLAQVCHTPGCQVHTTDICLLT